jgi:branched-chain amino acid transport system substrate-binding protein
MRKILCLTILLMLLAVPAPAAEPIKIGLTAPMSGPWGNSGREMKQVVDLLTEALNAKGGVLGRKIEIIAVNDEGTPSGAVQAALTLARQNVTAVIGSLTSAATEASQIIFNEAKILQVSNGSTAVGLTERNLKYFFRTCPRDDEQSRVIVETLRKMNLRKIAILHDGSLYARGLADGVRSLAVQGGLEIVFKGALPPGGQDYTDILKKIRDSDPEGVFYAGYYQEVGVLLRQKKAMNWNAVFIGGDGANNADFVLIAGRQAAEGFYFLSPPLPGDLTTKEALAFLEKFKKKYGVPVQSIDSVLAGDAFRVITAAIGETRSTDPDTLADHLHKAFVDPSGLTGSINFNFKGDRLSDLYGVYRVDAEGRFVIQRMFQYRQIVK